MSGACCPPASSSKRADKIIVNDLSLTVILEDGIRWPSTSPRPQPVLLTLAITHDCAQAAAHDDLASSINYSSICSAIKNNLEHTDGSRSYPSASELLDAVFQTCFDQFAEIQELALNLTKTKSLLHSKYAKLEVSRTRTNKVLYQRFIIEDLSCLAIIGVNACEREEQQIVMVSIAVDRANHDLPTVTFREVEKVVVNTVAPSSYLTLESLTSAVARAILLALGNETDVITVRAAKPSALVFAESSQVEMVRTLADYRPRSAKQADAYVTSLGTSPLKSLLGGLVKEIHQLISRKELHYATIALGSNLGDRFAQIEHALRLLDMPSQALNNETDAYVAVINTSFLYETAPMYVTKQPKFINGACTIETNLTPEQLLVLVKKIEDIVGRIPSIRNGPRAVDLDILTYDSEMIDTRPPNQRSNLNNLPGQLVVPHPRITEREFVLRPLQDIIPTYIHPQLGKSIASLLDTLLGSYSNNDFPMYKVIPFPCYPLPAPEDSTELRPPPTLTYWKYPLANSFSSSRSTPSNRFSTYIMATLNATPDSFSDGAAHDQVDAALAYASSSVASGANIIDVGGYSTRPGAAYVSPEDEIQRVTPVIQAIRSTNVPQSSSFSTPLSEKTKNTLISIDTFRASVARAAVLAGANCINDVYAFTGPAYPPNSSSALHFLEMRCTARELGVPVVLMHARGDAAGNKDYSVYEEYAGADVGVVEGVRVELGERVDCAVRGPGGVRRWNVIVDPGIGFSKTLEGNLQLLRRANDITAPCTLPRTPQHDGSDIRNPLAGFPLLIGASRKSFLGTVLAQPGGDGAYEGRETEPKERGWATATAVTSAVQQGAMVVRVHDAREMGDVVRVADALWK